MNRSRIHVLVIMGGPGSEREVSLSSGKSITKHLNKLGYQVSTLDLDKNIIENINNIKPTVVFNSMHGSLGEDGCLPGLLKILGIPFTHSDVLSSAICMDKPTTKDILMHHGINFAPGKVYSYDEIINNNIDMKRPFVIKPCAEGSSVGVHIISGNDNINLSSDKHIKPFYLVEKYIEGKEIQVGVIDGKAIACLEIKPKTHKFYDYETKYSKGLADHILPAPIPEKFYNQALEWAAKAHNILKCKGISRSDLRYDDKKQELYFLEINSHPGFTSLSLLPEIAKYKGMSFADICDFLVRDALCQN